MTPDKLLDLPDASEYGGSDDKWLKNAELFLELLLEEEKAPNQPNESSSEAIKG